MAVKEYALSLPEDVQDLYWRSAKSSISQTQRQVARKIEMTMPTLTTECASSVESTIELRRNAIAIYKFDGGCLSFDSSYDTLKGLPWKKLSQMVVAVETLCLSEERSGRTFVLTGNLCLACLDPIYL